MTEMPKCPYCGEKMALKVLEEQKNKWNARYICNKCHSTGPYANECQEKSYAEEVALAYTLHRAEPENRPLTLEELKAHCAKGRDAEPLWVEYDTVRDMALWVLANTPNGMDEKDVPSLMYWLKDEELVSEYGKFWRCWTQKPTPEQMAAAEWEE